VCLDSLWVWRMDLIKAKRNEGVNTTKDEARPRTDTEGGCSRIK
jgi:hypothetical protein